MFYYDVIDKILDSKDATVGGGAASAVAGAMSAGLIGMVARLSAGKGLGLDDSRYIEIAEELDVLAEQLKNGAIADVEAYLGIKAAFALPKISEEAKAHRRNAIEKAAIIAAEVPLNNGKNAQRILEICNEMAGYFNSAAASDMEAGILLAKMAVLDTALNIEANLSLIKSSEENQRLKNAANALKQFLEKEDATDE